MSSENRSGLRLLLWAVAVLCLSSGLRADETAQVSKDRAIVETVLRLSGIDIHANAPVKAAVLRYLQRERGTDRYFVLIERFQIEELASELVGMIVDQSTNTASVRAAKLLLRFDNNKRIQEVLDRQSGEAAMRMASALGQVGDGAAIELLKPYTIQSQRTASFRNAVATALGNNLDGQRFLLQLVKQQQLPKDMQFTVANVLFASADAQIRETVEKHLSLPSTAGNTRLPPVGELAARTGDVSVGKQVYANKGTCAKCHKVNGEGKEVGPDLSQIGSKLSREAMFVAILAPSAGISHNYESYTLVTEEGKVVTGVKVSETDETFTLTTAEAVVQSFAKNELEQIVKQPISLMPADLQKNLSLDELVSLVDYLVTLKKK